MAKYTNKKKQLTTVHSGVSVVTDKTTNQLRPEMID